MKHRFLSVLILGFALPSCAGDAQRSSAIDRESGERVEIGLAGGLPQSLAIEISGDAISDQISKPADTGFVMEGTGQYLGPVSPVRSRTTADGKHVLSVEAAPLEDFTRFVLGELLAVPFAIEDSLEGEISLSGSEPMSKEELLDVLELALSSHGYGFFENQGVIRVTSQLSAQRLSGLSVAGSQGPRPPGYASEIFKIRHVSPDSLISVIERFVPETSGLAAVSGRGLLLVSGDRRARESAQQLVEMFDVDQLAARSFALFPVTSAHPSTIIQELYAVFDDGSGAGLSDRLQLIPITRLNAILVISRHSESLLTVREWISRLDKGQATDRQKLYVYYVQHGDASEVVATLESIFLRRRTGALPVGANTNAGSVAPGLEPRRLGEESQSRSGRNESAMIGVEPSTTGDAASVGTATFTADSANNAIFILATPRQYELIEGAIEHIDIRPTQVMIEATIAEVVLNDELRYGVQWFFREGDHGLNLSEVQSGVPAAEFPGFSYALEKVNADVVLNALEGVTDINVISSPQILVLDNRTAELRVGDQVPVATQSAISVQNPDAPIVNQIEFKDTGIILRVSPKVNSSGTVTLDVEQEVSNVVPTTTSGIDSPTIQQRIIKSTIAVDSGQSIALGGLIRDGQNRINSGIPVLSRIPVLGGLFGQKRTETSRTELLIIVTPRIISTPDDAEEMTNDLRTRLQEAFSLLSRTGAE